MDGATEALPDDPKIPLDAAARAKFLLVARSRAVAEAVAQAKASDDEEDDEDDAQDDVQGDTDEVEPERAESPENGGIGGGQKDPGPSPSSASRAGPPNGNVCPKRQADVPQEKVEAKKIKDGSLKGEPADA